MFFLVCLVVLVTVLAVAGAVLVEVGRSVSRGFGTRCTRTVRRVRSGRDTLPGADCQDETLAGTVSAPTSCSSSRRARRSRVAGQAFGASSR